MNACVETRNLEFKLIGGQTSSLEYEEPGSIWTEPVQSRPNRSKAAQTRPDEQ